MQEMTSASTEELARLGELIDSIYQGATDPSHWNTVLPEIADWVGAERGLLFTPLNSPDNGGFYFNHAIPESKMQLWATKYHAHDIWANRAAELGLMYEGNVIDCDEIVPFNELSRTEFYQDFLSTHDIAHLLSSIVYGMDNPQTSPAVVCSLFRGVHGGRFTESKRNRISILLPHISRAVGVMSRLRGMELKLAANLTALDKITSGILLFRPDGIVSFANRTARRILDEEDGLGMQLRFNDSALGNVIAEEPDAHEALTAAIRNAVLPDVLHTEHFSHAVKVPRPSGRPDYVLNFSSLAMHNEFGSGSDAPRAIAFITDNAEPIRLDGDLLRKTYGLTPAEIRLAGMLVECLTVDETAERLGVSRSTVKAQQQSIYTKTSTNTRAKLMKLLMSLAQLANLAVMAVINCASGFSDSLLWLSFGQQMI